MPKSMDRNLLRRQETKEHFPLAAFPVTIRVSNQSRSLALCTSIAETRFRSGNFHDADDGVYRSGGNTIGSGGWEAGQERFCFAAISPMTRSQRTFPKLL